MSESYTPVFHSILESTIWGEAPHVKVVWLTMLLQKDRRGFVHSTIPGLARAAVVTVEQCKEAIDILSSADEYSQSSDLDGRRIVKVDGGWQVVNHSKYSDLTLKSGRERSRRFREKQLEDRYGAKEEVETLRPVTTSGVIDVDLRSNISLSSLGESEGAAKRRRRSLVDCPETIEALAPTEATMRVASETGLDISAEFEKMRDWALGKGEQKVDWQAALRNWMRQTAERRTAHRPTQHKKPPQPNDEANRYKIRGIDYD